MELLAYAAACTERLRLLNPVGAGVSEDCDQLEQLAADVIPQFS